MSSGSIDVNAFTAAREFEINALQNTMRTAKYVSTRILDIKMVELLSLNEHSRMFLVVCEDELQVIM
jgi:hypothetical protein